MILRRTFLQALSVSNLSLESGKLRLEAPRPLEAYYQRGHWLMGDSLQACCRYACLDDVASGWDVMQRFCVPCLNITWFAEKAACGGLSGFLRWSTLPHASVCFAITVQTVFFSGHHRDRGICFVWHCRQVAAELAVTPRRISQEGIALLQRYAIPGNLRKLKNMLERAYILSSNEKLGPKDLPLTITDSAMRSEANQAIVAAVPAFTENYFDLTALLERTEKDLIIRTLAASGGNQAEVGRRMGLSRSALGYKLSKYGITNKEQTRRVNCEYSQMRPPPDH